MRTERHVAARPGAAGRLAGLLAAALLAAGIPLLVGGASAGAYAATWQVTTEPTMSGNPTVGSTLTVHPGATTPSAYSTAVYWYRRLATGGETTEFPTGGSHLTYTPTAADVGNQVVAEVVYQERMYDATTTIRRTLSAGTIAKGTFQVSQPPSVTGDSKVGNTLTANPGTTTPAAYSLAYQWQRNGLALSGQTAPTYQVASGDQGSVLSVAVTYSSAGYNTLVQSASTAGPVAAGQMQSSQMPTIAGTAAVGRTLQAKPGSSSPVAASVVYQWLRNGVALSGQTRSTYVVVAKDAGAHVSVAVTYSTPGYSPLKEVSAATSKVALGRFVVAKAGHIAGTYKVGHTLTAYPATLRPSSTHLTFQWLRNGTAIRGATTSHYGLVHAGLGKAISVRIRYTRAGYVTLTQTLREPPVATVGR